MVGFSKSLTTPQKTQTLSPKPEAPRILGARSAGLLAMLRLGRWGAAGDMAVLLQDADQAGGWGGV